MERTLKGEQQDLWIGVLGVTVALVALWPVATGALGDPLDVSTPAFFPMVAGLLIGLAALSVLVDAALRLGSPRWAWPRPWRVPGLMPAMGLLIAYAMLVPVLGMGLASALAVPGLAWIFGLRHMGVLLLLAIVPPWLVIWLFESALNILFPRFALT